MFVSPSDSCSASKTTGHAVDAVTRPACPFRGRNMPRGLSYFLWATGPDDELFKLGESGKLSRAGRPRSTNHADVGLAESASR